MAQISNAQREPSMEEILASIRRIIEDSDAAPKEFAVSSPSSGSEIPEPANDVRDVDAFRAELYASDPAELAAPAEAERPMTLAQVHARMEADRRKPADEPSEAGDPGLSVDVPAGEKSGLETVGTAIEHDDGDLDFDLGQVIAQGVAESPDEHEDPAPAHAVTAKPAILSDFAGRQVAASFGELSEAFAASRRKSFDEMAEEMMRPMLQDWLDNNLPTLVERLVREEIERVARGGHPSKARD